MAILKRPHRRKAVDSLVPINGDRVAAALEWKRLTVNGAATKTTLRQQTLDTIVRGKTQRCYQSVRDTLSGLVGVPAPWLGQEVELLPSIASWWSDRLPTAFFAGVTGLDLAEPTTLPPRHQLAAHSLGSRIITAWKRDLDKGKAGAKASFDQLGTGRWAERSWDRVMMLVTRLLSAYWWRRRFLERPALAFMTMGASVFTEAQWQTITEGLAVQHQRLATEEWEAGEQYAVGAAAAWSALLGPWLAGERDLHYPGLIDSLSWAAGGLEHGV